jgi:hypothetical protein
VGGARFSELQDCRFRQSQWITTAVDSFVTFSYDAGMNMPKAIIEWIKGNEIDSSMFQLSYGKMFAKNDYLVEIR